MKRVVAIGGGTGMPILIKSLLELVDAVEVIVTIADDGGSSGRLRGEFNGFPPGDSRNCLVAMANGSTLSRLFQHRFKHGEGLKGHALGNLIISALVEQTGDFRTALDVAGSLIGARGRVLPPATVPLTLGAELASGGVVLGQCNIANRLRPLNSIFIEPADAEANPDAVEAVRRADVIIFGPGSLFTSVIPNLLVAGLALAVQESGAYKAFLCNITVQPGETDGFTAADHLKALLEHGKFGGCDLVITNSCELSQGALRGLEAVKSPPVLVDAERLLDLGVVHVSADLSDRGYPAHHDSGKLAAVLKEFI